MRRKATREERTGEEEVAKGEVDVEMKVVALLVEVVARLVEVGVLQLEEVPQAEEVVLLVEEEESVHQEGAEVEEGEAKAGMGWCRRTNLSHIFLQKRSRGGYMMGRWWKGS